MFFSKFLKEMSYIKYGEYSFKLKNIYLSDFKNIKEYRSLKNFKNDFNIKIYFNDFTYLLCIDNFVIYKFDVLHIKRQNLRYIEIINASYVEQEKLEINYRGNKITEKFYSFLLDEDFKILTGLKQSDPIRKIWLNISKKYYSYYYNVDTEELIKIKLLKDDERIYSNDENNISFKNKRLLFSKDKL